MDLDKILAEFLENGYFNFNGLLVLDRLKLIQLAIDGQKLKAEQDAHMCSLNVLRDTLARLKEEGNTKALVSDVKQYFVDVGGVNGND